MRTRLLLASAAAAVLVLTACGSDAPPGALLDDDPAATPTPVAPSPTGPPPAVPPPAAQLEGLEITATRIVDTPMLTAIAWRGGDPDPYLADQHGEIFQVVDGAAVQVLDLTAEVRDYEQDAEFGMLGMTFDPVDGRMILGYNDTGMDTRIVSFAVDDHGQPDPDSAREILHVEQPGPGHNSGHLAFDSDDNLIISMGDGGGSRGADAQDMTSLHGAILRITPDRTGGGYTVPDDNPYVGQDDIAPEIWAKGMRNPWRFSIDHPTGDLWLGDVGQDGWESVYRIPADAGGANLGWPTYEGSHELNFNPDVEPADDAMMPVHEYSHDVGRAVIGGYVYRGEAIPDLQGAYVFMDMTGPLWAMGAEGTDGVVRLDLAVGGVQTSFGEDPDGELYILTLRDGAFKLEPSS